MGSVSLVKFKTKPSKRSGNSVSLSIMYKLPAQHIDEAEHSSIPLIEFMTDIIMGDVLFN